VGADTLKCIFWGVPSTLQAFI